MYVGSDSTMLYTNVLQRASAARLMKKPRDCHCPATCNWGTAFIASSEASVVRERVADGSVSEEIYIGDNILGFGKRCVPYCGNRAAEVSQWLHEFCATGNEASIVVD